MEEKNLPIKIFQKRQVQDDRLTEAGGNSQLPKWVLTGEALRARSEVLLYEVKAVEKQVHTRLNKYKNVPAVLKAKVSDDAIAKTHRKELSRFLSPNQQDRVLGFTENQEILIRVDEPKHLVTISRNIEDVNQFSRAISGIEAIETFEPSFQLEDIKVNAEGKYVLKIRLVDYNNFHINSYAYEYFKNILATNKHLVLDKSVRYADDLVIHQITTDSLDAIHELDDFSALLSVEPMPTIDLIEDDFFVEETIHFPIPSEEDTYPSIGILDSGIANIPQLRPWIVGNRYTNYPQDYLDPSHGTFVAGVACFGDLLEGNNYTGVVGCKLFDAAVFPNPRKESITEADLVDNVREAIEKNRDQIKIWNMSLGSRVEVKYTEFSDFGIALDNIQDENEILIIKSAGNCDNFLVGGTISRIANGADSVRALTIGSIAPSQGASDIAEKNHLSPFSRVGPGPSNIVKPDLVHYGGNAGIGMDGSFLSNGVSSFQMNGNLKKAIGTSFSTPRVAAIVADLHNRLREDFDPLLLKALIIHSAKHPQGVNLPINEKLNQFGFGLPSTASDILYNNPNEITLILRESLNKGEFLEILDFPFPESLVDQEGRIYGQIILTVVNAPLLASGQGTEYCQSNLDVMFGTYDQKTQRDTTKRTIRNPIGKDGSQNLLAASVYSKKNSSKEKQAFGLSEKLLVQYGDKFYPNKKYAVDLSELTTVNKEKYLQAPKKWYLKVTGLYRDFIEKKAEEDRMDLAQEYCIVLTIRDPLRKAPVYDEVTRQLNINNFIHRDIRLKQAVEIHVTDADGE